VTNEKEKLGLRRVVAYIYICSEREKKVKKFKIKNYRKYKENFQKNTRKNTRSEAQVLFKQELHIYIHLPKLKMKT